MTPDGFSNLLITIGVFIVFPWCAWVTVSLFNQRTEISLLKQIMHDVKAIAHRGRD